MNSSVKAIRHKDTVVVLMSAESVQYLMCLCNRMWAEEWQGQEWQGQEWDFIDDLGRSLHEVFREGEG